MGNITKMSDLMAVNSDNAQVLGKFVYRFMSKEFERFHQIAVFGTRKRRGDGTELVTSLMASVEDLSKIPELSELPKGRYAIPTQAAEVPVFKGAVFNMAELARQLASSKSLAKKLGKSALDGAAKRPVLPLNVGQVGLIGGSGLINGLAMCDNPHIIKGRIIKVISATEDVTQTDRLGNAAKTTRTETTSNQLVFNILTSAGFKSLT